MKGYKEIMEKLTGILTPLWTIISIVAGIAYFTYLVASWGIKQEQNDIQLESRLNIVEQGFKEMSTKLDNIQVSIRELKNNEMVN